MYEDIIRLCNNIPEVKEVLNMMEEYLFECDRPREELEFKTMQNNLIEIENKFLKIQAPQQVIIYLNSLYYFMIGRLKKLSDPSGSQKHFEESLKMANHLKDFRMSR
jgi:hypothetical protein